MLEKYPYEFPVINTTYDSIFALSLRFRNLVFHNSDAQEVCRLRFFAHTYVAAQENKFMCSKEYSYLGRERVEILGRARPKKTNLQIDGSQIIGRLDYRLTSTCGILHLQACEFTLNVCYQHADKFKCLFMKTKSQVCSYSGTKVSRRFCEKSCHLKKKRGVRLAFEKRQNRKLFQEMTSVDSNGCSEDCPCLQC
jgi:hypothetical protein